MYVSTQDLISTQDYGHMSGWYHLAELHMIHYDTEKYGRYTGCCKTSGQLWKPVTDAFFKVFLMFLSSFDCQLWAIFHFGTLNA